MMETQMDIIVLREVKVMTFKDQFIKWCIIIFSLTLIKSFLDIRHPVTPKTENYVVVIEPNLEEWEPLDGI